MTKTGAEVVGGVIEGPPPSGRKFRAMIFTWFHENPIEFDPKMRYLRYGVEICPSTGKKHLQGWLYWINERSERACCKEYKCWMRGMKGSYEENDIYTGKENNIVEYGIKPKQGERTDLESKKNEIVNGKSVDEIVMENPMVYHQYGRTLNRIEDIVMRKKWRTEMTTCDWIWGESGCGKSHSALATYDPDTHYLYRNDDGWWEGYKQQPIVVINEFRGEIKYKDLLELIDKWPYFVRRRNREPIPFISKHIIITSVLRPEEIYHNVNSRDNIVQLLRRVNVKRIGAEVEKFEIMEE